MPPSVPQRRTRCSIFFFFYGSPPAGTSGTFEELSRKVLCHSSGERRGVSDGDPEVFVTIFTAIHHLGTVHLWTEPAAVPGAGRLA